MLIDMHSHILPCADHGSSSLQESLSMIEKAGAVGIKTVLATPHFYPHKDTVESFLERRERAYDLLADAAGGKGIKIVKAAEVALSADLAKMKDLEKLCIEGTGYMLLEMPYGKWTRWVYDAVARIQAMRNITPIIAHIDRYDTNSLDRLLETDVITQMNAQPLSTVFGRMRVKKYLDRVYLLGSDAHFGRSGAPEYRQFAAAVKYLGPRAETMMENARIVLGI